MAEETQVVKYSVVEADIAQMKSVYMDLKITDLEDVEQFKQVKEARLIVKGKRCAVENERKKLKSGALAWGKKVDGRAKEIFALIEPIENHLIAEEQKVLDEQERIKAEEAEKDRLKIEKRVKDLAAVGLEIPWNGTIEIAVMSDDEFQCFYDDKKFAFDEAQKAKAEAEAAEKERLAKEEAERKAEAKRLADQKAEQDAKEVALKKQQDELAAQQKAIDDEKDRIAREEQAKKDAENARIKTEEDAKAKAEQEEKERQEREAEAQAEVERQDALKPDKEKLSDWINFFDRIENNPHPKLKTQEARDLFDGILDDLQIFLQEALESIENL